MKSAFHEIAQSKYSSSQVSLRAKAMGLACNRNRFFQAIRNSVYCGKIFIEKYKDEKGHLVKGLPEGIISKSLFYEVQDLLDGNKRKIKTTILSPKMLPLKTGYFQPNHETNLG
jgi:site-specific DNA recombinase